MINLPLFRSTLKRNWILWLIFVSVISMYLVVMIAMYDPDDISAIMSMIELFPEDLMRAMNFSSAVTDLTSYLASWLYGMLMTAFPLAYCIILGNRLVAKSVDNGSFAYYLSTPNSRVKIISTLGIYAVLSTAFMFAATFGIGVVLSEATFPGLLDIPSFLKLNVITMLVNTVAIMITFFSSCLFNEVKNSLGIGAGITIFFYLMNMLGGVSSDAEILKKISIYGFYDPVNVVRGGITWDINLIYICIIVVLFVSSILVFKKRRLPL